MQQGMSAALRRWAIKLLPLLEVAFRCRNRPVRKSRRQDEMADVERGRKDGDRAGSRSLA
jgi:hypothetical protein